MKEYNRSFDFWGHFTIKIIRYDTKNTIRLKWKKKIKLKMGIKGIVIKK